MEANANCDNFYSINLQTHQTCETKQTQGNYKQREKQQNNVKGCKCKKHITPRCKHDKDICVTPPNVITYDMDHTAT